MHNPAAVLENDTHDLLWEFDTQTDHQISATRPDLIKSKKKKENLWIFLPGWTQKKIEKISTKTLLGDCKNYGT